MKNKFPFIRSIVVASLILFSITSHSKETINWIWYEQAPYFIGNSPLKGKGTGNSLLKMYVKNLKEYNHNFIKVNANRYNIMIKKKNACVPIAWLSKSEKKHLIRSRPITLEPPVGVYIHKSSIDAFGKEKKSLSLKKLLTNKKLKLAYLDGLQYGKEVDKLIKDSRHSENLAKIVHTDIQIDLNMLKQKRIHYLLGLPSQRREQLTEKNQNEFLFYNIKEISQHIPIYSHCANSSLGKSIIDRINLLLTKDYLKSTYEDYEYWYGKNKKFKNNFMNYIINNKNNDSIVDRN